MTTTREHQSSSTMSQRHKISTSKQLTTLHTQFSIHHPKIRTTYTPMHHDPKVIFAAADAALAKERTASC